jgi:hypothetical protein
MSTALTASSVNAIVEATVGIGRRYEGQGFVFAIRVRTLLKPSNIELFEGWQKETRPTQAPYETPSSLRLLTCSLASLGTQPISVVSYF